MYVFPRKRTWWTFGEKGTKKGGGIAMTVKEARELLKTAPTGEKPARLNPTLTQSQAVGIVQDGVDDIGNRDGEDFVLSDLMEKRVWQVVRNQRRPRY